MSRNGQEALFDKLCHVIDYHVTEFKMSPIEVVGCLEVVKHDFIADQSGLVRIEDLEGGDDEQEW